MNNITMNSKTNITVTLTRKEAECLQWTADYAVNDEIGDFIDWRRAKTGNIQIRKPGRQKIWLALNRAKHAEALESAPR